MAKRLSQRLLESGALRSHRSSPREIGGLLAVVERDLADAAVIQVSLDRRFATAYSAALQLATIVLAASGFRVVVQRGHHAVTWQVLPEFLGTASTETALYFDSCRALRNAGDYDRSGVVSMRDVEEIQREAKALRDAVLGWLMTQHPQLVPE